MNWNDWEAAWRGQEPAVGGAADVAEIARTFETKRRKLACQLLLRNGAEGGTGVLLTPVLAWLAWRSGPAGWLAWLGVASFGGITAVFLVELWRGWRARPAPGIPLAAAVAMELAELRHQCRLIRTWWAWYLLPGTVGLVASFVGLGQANHGKAPPGLLTEILRTPTTLAWIAIFGAIVACGLVRVGRGLREARENMARRIDELEKLRRTLAGEDAAEKR